jgi:flagella basal body P-ring formation protein FlgA
MYDDFPLRNDVARSLDEVIGRVSRRAIRAELPVFRSDLMEPYQVQRGEIVQVTAISGAAQLSMEAVAQSSGRQGDTISLKNERSGKTFLARIEGKDRALVVVGPLAMPTRTQ